MMGHQPADFPRRILLALAGLTPQVITETVYALATQNGGLATPTEIHLLTTREGADRARLSLLGSDPGWFARLCEEYQLGPIAFDDSSIHVLGTATGEGLVDIRTLEDNLRAADEILDWIARFTADPQVSLHVSVAGGRKTMGYFAAYSLSLVGRIQDRLSHVLVPPLLSPIPPSTTLAVNAALSTRRPPTAGPWIPPRLSLPWPKFPSSGCATGCATISFPPLLAGASPILLPSPSVSSPPGRNL